MSSRPVPSLLIAASMLASGCAFEDAKPVATAEGPLAGRWCRPADASREVDGHRLAATWTFDLDDVDAAGATVRRTFDGVVFEDARWELTAEADGARLVRRSIATPEVLSAADEALVRAHPIDDLQALADRADPWATSVVVTRGSGDAACDVLPSAYGHGYPVAEGWYVAGAATADATSWDGGWYGHGGAAAGAPFATARSLQIVIDYDEDERMVAESLDRGASDGGPHDLLRARAFDAAGGLTEDRIERWSPTPKEDILRVLTFADEGPGSAAPRAHRHLAVRARRALHPASALSARVQQQVAVRA
ncbi:MAG: hypothetical protein U1F43_09070 [Myxococcota bacterium]